jgi:hypothetical protein
MAAGAEPGESATLQTKFAKALADWRIRPLPRRFVPR